MVVYRPVFGGLVFIVVLQVVNVAGQLTPGLPNQPGIPSVGSRPNSMEDLMGILQRTQSLLVQMSIRVGQLESRQNLLLKGRDGRDGKDGKEGRPGRDGRDGKDGEQGPAGINGAPGQPGRDGRDGKDGEPGLKGDRGDTGARGPSGPKGDPSGGVQYIRWGKTTCPHNSTLLYSGCMGGELYSSKGGGTNFLCMPHTPKYGKFEAAIQRSSSSIYGAEYQVKPFNPFKKNVNDQEVPCAACYVTTRSVKLMIPATNECPSGWTRDYHGYLMSSSRVHHPSEFVCVDEDAEGLPNSPKNRQGAMLYPVEGRCGALPCNLYINGRELTCVVCSK